jgi:hypothetical protein
MNRNLDRLISSIQFDRWIFGFPTLFTVVSHRDADHDPLRSIFNYPEPLIYSDNYTPKPVFGRRSLSFIYIQEGNSEIVRSVKVTPVLRRTLSRLLGIRVYRLHACWWFLATKEFLILFIGELDAPEIPILSKLLDKVQGLDALLLPSYGGMNPPAHQVAYRDELKVEVAKLAKRERAKGRALYGLPHPVIPEWAEMSAQRV